MGVLKEASPIAKVILCQLVRMIVSEEVKRNLKERINHIVG
jgi:hypothetical protein